MMSARWLLSRLWLLWTRCEAELDPIGRVDHVELHGPRIGGVAFSGLLGELDAIIAENGVDTIRHCIEHVPKELTSHRPSRLADKLDHGKFSYADNADEQVLLALSGLHLSNVDLRKADGLTLERRPLWVVTVPIGQSGLAAALKALIPR